MDSSGTTLFPGESLLGSLLEIQVLGHTSNRDKRAGLSSATCRVPSEKQSSRKAPRETAYVECGIRKGNRHGSGIWYSRLRALSSWGTGWRLGILKWWAAWTSRNCAHFLVFLGSSSRQGNFPVLLRSLSEAFCASALQKGLASHLWLFA